MSDHQQNYFLGTADSPHHLSVGAVLFNGQGQIAVHHFPDDGQPLASMYILMRETIEPEESIEGALSRGLQEEFGATGDLVEYLGSQNGVFHPHGATVYKTTVYFLVRLRTIDPASRRTGDDEERSTVEWHEPQFLLDRMAEQWDRYHTKTADESEIIRRALPLLKY